MMPVKICGITTLRDAELAVQLGAAAIGFVFYGPSPRYIEPATAQNISQRMGTRVCKVGVFVNTAVPLINRISREAGLDMVQLSGNEAASGLAEIALPIIKTVHVDDQFDITEATAVAATYPVKALLFDSKLPGHYGGTGQTWNWERMDFTQISKPVILSGGLNPENIRWAIESTRPSAVDVSTGVEAAAGKKSPAKLKTLFKALADYEGTDEQPFK